MAKLRSALARGGSRALSGLSEGITQLQQQRLEEARLEAQRRFQMELAEKAFQRQQLLQDDSQAFQLQLRDAERQAALAEEQRRGKIQLGSDANVPGVDPAQIAARAQGLGMGDEFFPGTGSRINMPDDPRLSPEFRGKSITNFAMPIRPAGSERPPIEQLLQQAMSSQRTGLKQAFNEKQEEFEAQPFVDESGTEVIQGPSGELRPTERNVEQEGTRQARITDIVTPAAGRRAFTTARQSAAGNPQVVGGMNPLTGEPIFGRVGPTGGAEMIEGLAPKPTGTGGADGGVDGNTAARIAMAQELFRSYKEGSEDINISDRPGQLLEGARRYLGQFRGDTTAEQFGKITPATAATIMSAISGAQSSDTERQTFVNLLAGFTTSKTVAQRINQAVERMLNEAAQGRPRSNREIIAGMLDAANGDDENEIIDFNDLQPAR